MDVRFVIVSPSGKQRSTTKRLPILVGRSEEARFRIPQDCVSRRHCEFLAKDGQVFVRDLGSTNGTLLDDEEIPANVPALVHPGGVVKVGGIAVRVEYDAPVAAHETPAPADGDTVPLAADGCPAESAAPASPAAAGLDDAGGGAAAAEAAPGDFGFLGVAEPEAAAEPPAGWPETGADSPQADEGDLDDFFKSLK